MTAVLAFDLSMTSTGWAQWVGGGSDCGRLCPPVAFQHETGMRLAWIRARIEKLLTLPWDHVLIEKLPSSAGQKVDTSSIAMVHSIMHLALYDTHHKATWVQQAKIKMFATGKGNASKAEVLTAAVRRLGYQGSSTDEADSLWLLHMGLAHLGECPVELPQSHTLALEGIDWQ